MNGLTHKHTTWYTYIVGLRAFGFTIATQTLDK